MISLYPSLIAADQLNLEQVVRLLENHCSGFHCDIMDNHFVPNLTWGAPTVNALNSLVTQPLWVHLMVDNPLAFLEQLELQPGSMVSFHIESQVCVAKTVEQIKAKKWSASLAINPATPVQSVISFLPLIDQLLVMSVEPGFSGQPFIADSLLKIQTLVATRQSLQLNFTIGVDGGIAAHNIAAICAAGGQALVVGSGLFDQPDPVAALAQLHAIVQAT